MATKQGIAALEASKTNKTRRRLQMTLKKLLLATTAVAMLGGLAAPAFAQTTVRLVSKDLLTTNPDDVREIEAIEAALKAQGHDIDIQTIDLPGGTSAYVDALGVMLLSGDIP